MTTRKPIKLKKPRAKKKSQEKENTEDITELFNQVSEMTRSLNELSQKMDSLLADTYDPDNSDEDEGVWQIRQSKIKKGSWDAYCIAANTDDVIVFYVGSQTQAENVADFLNTMDNPFPEIR